MGSTKQVILLGAGASKSDKAPMQSELFNEFFKGLSIKEAKKINHPKRWNLVEGQEKLIKDFFSDFWGIDIKTYRNNEEFPTFEECLGMLDLANLQGQSFKGYDQEKIIKTRIALIFIISDLLDNRKLKEINHKKLIERLKSENKLEETAFISLNYDILIDNALIDLIPEFYTDYGIEFINHKRPQDSEKSILRFKPHGSLNWLYCPTCNHIELCPKENCSITLFFETVNKQIFEKECKNCRTPMRFVIIPMTYYKEMSNPFIQQILLNADEILRNADKIFVCGYSFPDADMQIKYILKRAEIFKEKTPEIYVINKNPVAKEKQRETMRKGDEEKRFKRFFKDKVIFTGLSFQEFCENGYSN